MTLGEILRHIEMVEELSQGTKTALSDFWNLITESQKLSKEMVVSDLLKKIVSKINYKNYLLDGTEEGEMRYENILELISVASKYDGLEPQVSLASFLEEVALVADTDSLVDSENVITMMTLHSVKGLEFPYVFIVGCEENIFPHSRSLFDQEELEEERRLMYVGVTRAMKKVYLLAAKQRIIYGDYQSNAVSRFIHDIPEKLIVKTGFGENEEEFDIPKRGLRTQDSGFSSGPIRQRFDEDEKSSIRPQIAEEKFADGDKVTHPSFGVGIVVERRGDLVTVAFHDKKFGIKKFAANIAPLEKI
jgi:DNA helicase-2/ATP-dependent DNA helicase PcrA